MDSVIMTTPTPGNSMRLRSRLRSAANTICARSSKRALPSLAYKTHHHHYNHHRNNSSIVGTRNLTNRNNHHNNINNVSNQQRNNFALVMNGSTKQNSLSPAGLVPSSPTTREVYNAWCGRLGDVTRIPSDSVQALFNDMQLYPSKNQVLEMLQCARQCGRRNNSQFLTFGEFCVFAGELRRGGRGKQHHHNHRNNFHRHHPVQKVSKPLSSCEVFLGGSCNPTTWRADIAIPTLSKLGITYYNPQVSTWSPDLMAAEHDAKESAAVLLFVVDSQTRCVAGMLEVAHLIAKQRCLVIVVHPFTAGQSIMGEKITAQEHIDLSEGQSTLLTLVKNQGVAVHSNLTSALQCTVNILRGPDVVAETLAERKLTDKLMKLREVFDSADTNGIGELTLTEVSQAYYQLTGTNLRISDLYAIMDMSQRQSNNSSSSSSNNNKTKSNVANNRNRNGGGGGGGDLDDVHITFEQFCGIVAEFTTMDGCNNTTTSPSSPTINDDWLHQPLQRQSSTNNNTNFETINSNGHCYENETTTNNGYHYSHNNRLNNATTIQYDIYLGGSCMKRTTWRQKIAIPLLKRYGVTYYNPSLHEGTDMSNGNGTNGNNMDIDGNFNNDNDTTNTTIVRSASRDLLRDLHIMNDSKIVMFVITNETRSITSMILAAYYIAMKKNVVLCVQQLPVDDCNVGSEVLTKQAIKDYNRARAYLTDLAKHENVPIYETVQEAVECAIDLVRTKTPTIQQR